MGAGGSIPVLIDKEIEEKGLYLQTVEDELNVLESRLNATLHCWQSLLKSCEGVSNCFLNLAHGVDPETNAVAKDFDSEVRVLKEGEKMTALLFDTAQIMKSIARPVLMQREKATKLHKAVLDAMRFYSKLRQDVEKIEVAAARKNKPLAEDSVYVKKVKERDLAFGKLESTKNLFHEAMSQLMDVMSGFVLNGLAKYTLCTSSYTKCFVNELERVQTTPRVAARITEIVKDIQQKSSTYCEE
ncbi:hypothetical protein ERJ75_000324100 [Trypanosoma vivax]|nr:hypothetical protein TRVL_04904 [Trypanosoma vivax]KAH8617926.1 hypothetical protein ERJ75_000324100 [Trypanosoma vivax]